MIIANLFQNKLPYNYLSAENNVKIISCSSNNNIFPPNNLFMQLSHTLWLSDGRVPQEIVFSLRNIIRHPTNLFTVFGVYLKYSVETNPKKIQLLFSKDNINFISYGLYEIKWKSGIQLFKINKKESHCLNYNAIYGEWEYNYCKIIITETYGGNRKCYINKLYLFDDNDITNYLSNIEKVLNEKIEFIRSEGGFTYEKPRDDLFMNEIKENINESCKETEEQTQYLNTKEEYDKIFNPGYRTYLTDKQIENKKLINKVSQLVKNPNITIKNKRICKNTNNESFLSMETEANEDEGKNIKESGKCYLNIPQKKNLNENITNWGFLHQSLDQLQNSILQMGNKNINYNENLEKRVSKLEKSVSRLENEIYNNAYQDNEIYNDEFTKKLHNILSEKDNKIIYEKNKLYYC